MTLILSMETATRVCSVAVHDNGDLMGLQEMDLEKSHSEHLVPMIMTMFGGLNYRLKDLDAVAVSIGPGSYTGLRIGISTAKGLAYGLELPVLAVNTLEAMAAGVAKYSPESALLCPMIDARRMEVYCMVCKKDLRQVEPTQPKIVGPDAFQNLLADQQIWFFGDGSDKVRAIVDEGRAVFVPDIVPSAKFVGELAFRNHQIGEFEDLAYFEPLYLKDFRTTKPKLGF